MKWRFFLAFALGLCMSAAAMASMTIGEVRAETRFLTDKMAHELRLNVAQRDDVYEINYDFLYSVRYLLDGVARGEAGALSDYYEALDIRNDDLRWVLSDSQYRKFLRAEYFCRPVVVTGGRWAFRVYVNYPDRSLFYFGVPPHYYTYNGAHRRSHFSCVSFYRGRHSRLSHYPAPHRVRPPRHPAPPVRPVPPRRPERPVPPKPPVSHREPARPKPEHRPQPSRRPVVERPSRPSRSSVSERPTRRSSVPVQRENRRERAQRATD